MAKSISFVPPELLKTVAIASGLTGIIWAGVSIYNGSLQAYVAKHTDYVSPTIKSYFTKQPFDHVKVQAINDARGDKISDILTHYHQNQEFTVIKHKMALKARFSWYSDIMQGQQTHTDRAQAIELASSQVSSQATAILDALNHKVPLAEADIRSLAQNTQYLDKQIAGIGKAARDQLYDLGKFSPVRMYSDGVNNTVTTPATVNTPAYFTKYTNFDFYPVVNRYDARTGQSGIHDLGSRMPSGKFHPYNCQMGGLNNDYDFFSALVEQDSVVSLKFGVLFLLALSSLGVYSVILAARFSTADYAFIGALRFAVT